MSPKNSGFQSVTKNILHGSSETSYSVDTFQGISLFGNIRYPFKPLRQKLSKKATKAVFVGVAFSLKQMYKVL